MIPVPPPPAPTPPPPTPAPEPASKPDPTNILPNDKVVPETGATAQPPPAPKKKGKLLNIYLIAGIIAIVLVIIICICIRQKRKHSHQGKRIDAGDAHTFAPVDHKEAMVDTTAD